MDIYKNRRRTFIYRYIKISRSSEGHLKDLEKFNFKTVVGRLVTGVSGLEQFFAKFSLLRRFLPFCFISRLEVLSQIDSNASTIR
jgi:hypothetical protein